MGYTLGAPRVYLAYSLDYTRVQSSQVVNLGEAFVKLIVAYLANTLHCLYSFSIVDFEHNILTKKGNATSSIVCLVYI